MNRSLHLSNFIESYYQPIVTVDGNWTYAIEALLRFKDGGALPQKRLRQWEKTSYISFVDRLMVGKVRDMLTHHPRRWRIAVNVSHTTIEKTPDPYFEELRSLLPLAQRVILELNISHTKNVGALKEFAERCHRQGIYIALEDCNPLDPAWSESAVLAFRPRLLKLTGELIDRCFLTDAKEPIRDIVRLANSMHTVVIAKSVDSVEKRNFIAALGVELLQGYYPGKPTSVEDGAHLWRAIPRDLPQSLATTMSMSVTLAPYSQMVGEAA